jgi:2-deoxy-D-gluconate 3-dehydrogenase
MQLENKVAVITGAGQGLGRAIARAFVAEGAKVVIAELEPARGQAVAEALGAENAFFQQADVRDAMSVRAMVNAAVDRWERVDILVNNAGLFGRTPTEDLAEEEWDRILDTNLKGAFLCSQAAGRVMIRQGGGRVISLSSINGLVGFPERLAYNCSKAAIDALTRVLASEWGKYNINVNAIAPGYMATDNTAPLRADPARSQTILARIPAGRWGEPADLKGAVVFLASDAARYVHGAIVPVDGGWLAR